MTESTGADPPTYVGNVDAAIRRGAGDDAEYLFVVRGEEEAHAPGTLAFPGGKVETGPGDRGVVADAARREAREEVGVDIENPRLVTSTTFESDDGHTVLDLLVVAEYAGGEARVAAPDEVDAVEWRTADRVCDDDDVPPWTRESLAAVVSAVANESTEN